MRYNKNNWKRQLRIDLFGWLPPKIYLKVMPIYFKLVNSKRRKSECEFIKGEKMGFIALCGDEKLHFIDHRRLDRYMFKNGIKRIKNAMFNKYCDGKCSIENGDIVVEIGANIGEFTLAAAAIGKRIYAFEPDPNVAACLTLNIQSKENIEVIHCGASDKDEKKVFYLSSEDADSSFIKPKSYTDVLEVEAIRLDTWMERIGLDRIDFLKVEAEGAELEVLVGLGDHISKVKKISVDGGPERNGEPTYIDVNRFLESKGYHTKVIGWQVFAWK